MPKTKALVILSGGQDSTTCLFWAKDLFDEIFTLTFDYGQRHRKEIEAAKKIASLANIPSKNQTFLTVGNILKGTSPLVSNNELEQYENMYALPGGLEKTFVPGRNLLFLTIAANHAYNKNILNVIIGVCEEDFGGYPDCRQKFIHAAEHAIQQGFAYNDQDSFSGFKIHTPLMRKTKAETVLMSLNYPGCYNALAYTHTSYDGNYPPTGQDHATLLRAKGFVEADIPDPLVLRAHAEGLMALPDTPNYKHIKEPVQLSFDF